MVMRGRGSGFLSYACLGTGHGSFLGIVFVLGKSGEVEEGLLGSAKDRERIESVIEREYILN